MATDAIVRARAIDAAEVARVRTFREAAMKNGFSNLPVETGGKMPVHRNWQAGVSNDALLNIDPAAMSTGMLCSGWRVIDVDVDDKAKADKVWDVMVEDLGEPAMVRYRPNAYRFAAFYRAAVGKPGKRRIGPADCAVEVLGHGQQIVVDGVHLSGVHYEWGDQASPATVPIADVGAITEDRIGVFLAHCSDVLDVPREGAQGRAHADNIFDFPGGNLAIAFQQGETPVAANAELSAGVVVGWFPALPPEAMRQAVKTCLDGIDNTRSDPRDLWMRIVFAVADAGEAGCPDARELALEWSRRGANWSSDADFDKVWNSAGRRGGVTVGTLVHMAEAAGVDLRQFRARSQAPRLAGTNPGMPVDSPAHPLADAGWVDELNTQYAWIEKEAAIYRQGYADYIQPDKFRTQLNNQKVLGPNGKLVGKGSAWLDNPGRRQHREVVMRPGDDEVTQDNCLNEWAGFSIAPKPGDARWALRFLMRLVPDWSACKYILLWVAHLIQHPARRNRVALVFWSHEQGVGKNLLFECLVAIIGPKHAAVIGQDQLTGTFNTWANRRIFVIGDEVAGSDRREDADKLKGLITGTTLHVNEKYQPVLERPNQLSFIFLSNHNDAMFVGDTDRRYHVNEITSPRIGPAEAAAFVAKRNSGGLAALHYWLLRLNVSKFDPSAPAPTTAAKQQMIEDSRSDLESWLRDILASDVAALLGRELATAHELARRYALETGRSNPPSAKTIVGIFKKLGGYVRPTQVRLAGGRKVRAMALSRTDYWKAKSEAIWASELAKPLR